MNHTGSALLGLGAFLLAVAAIASDFGYLPSASFDGFTAATWGFFAFLAAVAAIGLYYVEDRDSHSSPFVRATTNRRGPKGRG